jgi:hypothetical protein
VTEESCDKELNQVVCDLGAVDVRCGALERVAEAVKGRAAPVRDAGNSVLLVLFGRCIGLLVSEGHFDSLELTTKGWFERGVEEALKELVNEPARDDCTANNGHFTRSGDWSVLVYGAGKPVGNDFPVLAERKCQVFDCSVEPTEPVGVFVVIENGARDCHALVRDRVLKLLDLSIAFEVVSFYFGVFGLCITLVRNAVLFKSRS